MAAPLRIESRMEGEETGLVVLVGEVDVANAPEVREAALGLMAKGARRFVADLSGITYMDSSGLGTLVGLLKRLREWGGKMAIAGAQPQVKRLFDITGLDEIFVMCDDAAGALKEVEG